MPLLTPTRLLISEKTSHLCISRFIRAPRLLGTPEYSVDPFIFLPKFPGPSFIPYPQSKSISDSTVDCHVHCRGTGNLGGMKSREGSTFERWIKIKYLIKIDQKINLTFSPDRRDHIFVHWNTGLMVAFHSTYSSFFKKFFFDVDFSVSTFLFFQSDQS